MFKVGQALLGQIPFPDGDFPKYSRPYLIVDVSPDEIGIVTVSSTAGKESKLVLTSNYSLGQYDPPFIKPSFVKLDSFQRIPVTIAIKMKLLNNGRCLNSTDMGYILTHLKR